MNFEKGAIMHNANIPDYTELPSTSKLIKSTIIAIVASAVILVTFVLPAEFGIDPTGIGKLTGLKRMGEIKVSLAQELESDQSAPLNQPIANEPLEYLPETSFSRSDELSVTLAPDKSTEIKITMLKDAKVDFTWSTDAGSAFYDLHGDSKDINYHIYEKGTESYKQGTLQAAFDGNHGWYWKNRSDTPITITLTTSGMYSAIQEMK